MADIVEFLANDQVNIGTVTAADGQRLTIRDLRGKTHRVASDRVLFRHSAPTADGVLGQIEALIEEIDLDLIWETVRSDDDLSAGEAAALARLFFERDDALHSSAMYRALVADGIYFRRRGDKFGPRTEQEVVQVRRMRQAEQEAKRERTNLRSGLRKRPIPPDLATRLEARIRGQADRPLDAALDGLGSDPLRHAFTLLVESKYLPATADFEPLAASLADAFPGPVLEHAAHLADKSHTETVGSSAFSIDDPDTREVDDALSVSRDGQLWRVDIDIANVASYVQIDDPLDREARRRGATVYLPTRRYYMLPESLSCDLASLLPGRDRPALRTSIWLDDQANVHRSALELVSTAVRRRLDYRAADQLIASGTEPESDSLRLLARLTDQLRERRLRNGALSIQRPEWKVSVSEGAETISVTPIEPKSASRALVGELMILANTTAASIARDAQVPLIYRVQPQPKEPLPPIDPHDPVALLRLRGLISPAALTLEPGAHFGLGVSAYTQITSPLRRYVDLVQQRQLLAHIQGQPPPYQPPDLLAVMAALEGVEQQLRRIEHAVTQRWTLEYVSRLPSRCGLAARITGEVAGGAKVVLLDSGAEGLLSLRGAAPALGTELAVDVDRINPGRGSLRLVPSRS